MSLKEFIRKNQEVIMDRWFKSIARTYENETTLFLINEKDPFSNPVGSAIKQSITSVLDILADGIPDENAMRSAVDPIIRIRAVQDYSASKAVSVMLLLKPAIRELIEKNRNSTLSQSDIEKLEGMFDSILLAAFDVFMSCREQIYSFKASHVRDRTKKLLEKAGLLAEVPEVGTQIMSHEAYKQNLGNN